MAEEDIPSPPEPQESQAVQHEAALAHLETLQDQLTALRTTLPSLLTPLTRPNTTKTEAFNGLKKAAVRAVSDVEAFRTRWETPQTQRILEQARESRERDGLLRAGDKVPVYGWTDGYGHVDAGVGAGQGETAVKKES